MADFITIMREFIFSPLGLVAIGILFGIVVYYILTRFFFKEKEDIFEVKLFSEAVSEDMDKKFELKGINVRASLIQGLDYLGTIRSWLRERGFFEPMVYDTKKKEFVIKKNAKKIPYDIFIFKLDSGNILTRLLGMATEKYIMVDSKQLEGFDNDDMGKNKNRKWVLKSAISFSCFGNVFISSDAGKEYLSDISIKNSHENVLTHLMNYPNKVVYLEMEHAKRTNYYMKRKEIDSKMWEKYKRGSEVETEDDDND